MQDFLTWSNSRPTVLTIGVFDGVHRGHQALLAAAARLARRTAATSAALTLHPRPRDVLRPTGTGQYITTLAERIALIQAQGIDEVVVLRFSREVAALTAAEFVRSLTERCQLRALVIGADFALGRGREGTPAVLSALGAASGFAVEVVPPVIEAESRVSTSRVQAALEAGHVDQAALLLGRRPAVTGPVVEGFRRGRTLAMPTANVAVPAGLLLPADGVYAVRCRLLPPVAVGGVTAGAVAGDIWTGPCDGLAAGSTADAPLAGAASIGIRPTFDGGARKVEVHLLDFDADIYGRCLRVEFVRRLRPELKFDSVEALVTQMRQDLVDTRLTLAEDHDAERAQ